MTDETTNRVAELNDRFRQTVGMPVFGKAPGRVYMTAGISSLAPEAQIAIAAEVREFSSFCEDNGPHGEHDFGAFDFPGAGRIFWKIDYYAPDMQHGSDDPADPAKTVRVLTIMLASEY